ncbi:MAG: hypothetical protein AB1403_15810, partial [Candidatus Riflebacteria bacterium]
GNEFWPGQAQCLFNLARDGGISLTSDSYTFFDANLTMNALYFGGWSGVLHSKGIDEAINKGERFMYRLNARGLEPSVDLLIVAGNEPEILEENWENDMKISGLIGGMIMKACAHESDGAVFVENALHTKEVLARGARLLDAKVFNLNHVDIGRRKEVIQWVDGWLLRP